jgi:hypothetical protein
MVNDNILDKAFVEVGRQMENALTRLADRQYESQAGQSIVLFNEARTAQITITELMEEAGLLGELEDE